MQPIDQARLTAAIAYASRIHQDQRRKSAGDVPYLCHPLQVCGLVLEFGGDTDQAIAGLLHDAVEDVPDVTRESLAAAFGERVARIVMDCTDTLPGDTPAQKSPWRERKERYLAHLREVPDDSLLVAACDKRHNLDSLLGDLRVQGLGTLEAFKGTPLDQVWFYEQVLALTDGRVPRRLHLELEDHVDMLRHLIQGGDTQVFHKERVSPTS